MELSNTLCLIFFFILLSDFVICVRILEPRIIPYLKRRRQFDEFVSRRDYNRIQHNPEYPYFGHFERHEFDCSANKVGSFGDPSQECRVFHVCQLDGRHDSFFCPAATRFNDQLQLCDWKQKVDHRCNTQTEIVEIEQNHISHMQTNGDVEHQYRNKYQEQEYYKTIYNQPDSKLAYVLQSPFDFLHGKKYVSQPIFTYLQPPQAPLDDKQTLAEDESGADIKTLVNEVVQSDVEIAPAVETDNSQTFIDNTKTRSAIENGVSVQHLAGTDGDGIRENSAGGFEINPVIELWIPAKVFKMTR